MHWSQLLRMFWFALHAAVTPTDARDDAAVGRDNARFPQTAALQNKRRPAPVRPKPQGVGRAQCLRAQVFVEMGATWTARMAEAGRGVDAAALDNPVAVGGRDHFAVDHFAFENAVQTSEVSPFIAIHSPRCP
jgi:hypothetical protein